MISVLLIGMGKFGRTLGEKLLELGDEVMIVDKSEDVINSLAPRYTNALIANCMSMDNLETMDIPPSMRASLPSARTSRRRWRSRPI